MLAYTGTIAFAVAADLPNPPKSWADLLTGSYKIAAGDVGKASQSNAAVLACAIATGGDERRLDPDAASKPARGDMVVVPRLDVRASAGPGALADLELKLGHYGFDRAWLQRMSAGRPDNLSVVRVDGDSMAPTLLAGDDILVERWQPGDRLRDGIYVLHRDDALLVKRLVLRPAPGRLDIISDNAAYPSWPDCDARELQVIGRVIWAGRRLG